MIEIIELHNFKSHRNTKINLDNSRLHALVGQNSSGKTSVLQALYALSRLVNSPPEIVFRHPFSPDSLVTAGQRDLSVMASGFWGCGEDLATWRAGYGFERLTDTAWQSPALIWKTDHSEGQANKWSEMFGNLAEYPVPQALISTINIKLMVANLAKAAYSEEIIPSVEYDGSGLAPTLDYFRNEVPNSFQYLQEWLKRIVPGVRMVGIRRAKVQVNRQRLIEVDGKSLSYNESQDVTGQEIVLDMNTGERIPAHAISEGTLLALGLLAFLANPKPPNLVLLDDIEQGLHPKAQRELVAVFKEIIQTNPNLQIIFSTHSPYIVDELKPSQVHVLNNNHAGFTHCKRLDEHPDAEWAIQTLTTGEFWSAEGEDWVVTGEQDA
ncbi:AAA family ATPase [Methylomagnum sp.]